MGFPLDALAAWGLINIVTLFITVIFCVGEDSVIFVPMWRAVWGVIPLNLAGKIVTCIASGILFLPTDICFFILIVVVRVFRHIGYAWWWIFAIDRADVLHRWHRFWECRDLYFGYWDEFDIARCDDEG